MEGNNRKKGGFKRWTDDDDAIILRMRAEKHSCSAIAEVIGVSRNAVVGRFNRLRAAGVDGASPPLPDQASKAGQASGKRASRRRKGVPVVPEVTLPPVGLPTAVKAAPVQPAPIQVETIQAVSVPEPPVPGQRRVTIFELRHNMCRYPLWGDDRHIPLDRKLFCGAPTQGDPWCCHHRPAMVTQYIPPARSARSPARRPA